MTKETSQKRVTYKDRVRQMLLSMEPGSKIDIESFIVQHWGDYNYYIKRSFDVYYSGVKSEIRQKDPSIEFVRTKGPDSYIKRIS